MELKVEEYGKLLFPLKYTSRRGSFYSSVSWNETGRAYLTERAAKNDMEKETTKSARKNLEIVKVLITEQFEIVHEQPKLSFCEWLSVIQNK